MTVNGAEAQLPAAHQDEACAVWTTLDDPIKAESLAKALVEQRLAACVQLDEVRSIYRWQGAIESALEVRLTIKTLRRLYPAVEALIRELHPYELPQIVCLPVVAGYEPYLAWLRSEVGGLAG
jgi:periplasmic divalent cation tolerance protein